MIRMLKAASPWLFRAFFLLVALSFIVEIPAWLVFVPLALAIAVPSPRADNESPRTMHAPVTGRWVAINSPATKVPSHGVRTLGQAFAVDILQASDLPREGALGWQWRQAAPQEFPSFGEPVLAAGSGVVIAAHDSKRDHRARNTWPGLIYMMTLEALGRELAGPRSIIGNHVILDHGNGTFSMYAHLKHGSAAVRVGQKVRVGDLLGAVGNTGNTSEPHLHFQLMDRPQAAMAAGLPFRWSPLTIEPDPDPYWAPKKPVTKTTEGLPATGQIFHIPDAFPAITITSESVSREPGQAPSNLRWGE